ncbi:MAG: hypothetical protein PHT51_03420 [Patescibacteria group bacterium]|nr:hypothetical protein [Patescibacteria group bacterium]MDD4610449.1 hypothetical protein [Patescibacteria group bacterium]
MKIIVKEENLPMQPEQILRQAGYGYIEDPVMEKESFVRHFGRERYPRFHMYINEKNGHIIFDLHLDQKKASYAGLHMHSAEYGGELVEAEIKRIKILISDLYRKTHIA